MEDLHFELRFMDDETVLHQLDLDEFQITAVKSEAPSFPGMLWTTLIVSLSGAQTEAIKAIPLKRFNGKFEHAAPPSPQETGSDR